MKIFVSFSGGKDSQACLIQACKEYGAGNVTAVFCDTGWEHELTYKHIDIVTKQLGVKLVVLQNKSVDGFSGLCKRMRWFPDTKLRMCTVRLKIQPMIDFILEQCDDLVIIQGIRAAESESRSKLPCSADYFAEYFADDKKGLYRKTAVRQWCQHHKATVERPMLGMSAQNIIDFIIGNGQLPNPLYRRGAVRVGCYPCIFSRLSEVKAMRKDNKYVQRLIQLEDEVNSLKEFPKKPSSFFPKGKIPERYCTKYGGGIPAFEDVITYVSRDDSQLDLFEPVEGFSCMSIYHGLCE
jgi:3'-phosphoadenosine 5'-phosphosulfate sulfotransferase (PAPS reductase)/FAD synthetase